MGKEEDGAGSAPISTIETLVVVRPIKVIAMILAGLAILLLFLSVASSSWIQANSMREGLWVACLYRTGNESHLVDCEPIATRSWLKTCQALSLVVAILCFAGILIITIGVKGDNAPKKFRFYMAGVGIWLAALLFQIICLIFYLVKFTAEMSDRSEVQWQVGWCYGVGWMAAIFILTAAILIVIDRKADEFLEREVIVKNEDAEEGEATEAL